MIPQILMAAYTMCLLHIANINSSVRSAVSSYDAGYEQCALIVPYVQRRLDAEWAAVRTKQAVTDSATLKAALGAMAHEH